MAYSPGLSAGRMKFLCDNCKAKYQIADEKVAGKTLRMKCRRCGHDILINGEGLVLEAEAERVDPRRGPSASQSRGGSGVGPAPRRIGGRGGSSVGPMPQRPASRRPPASSPLGADFRRQVGTGAPSEAARATPLDQWHVAINDVPVGPVKRDEIARKIAAGQVNGESLVWREGFDDWRPLRDVAELSVLLRARKPTPPPKPAVPPRPVAGRPPSGRTATASPRPPAGQPPRPAAPAPRPAPPDASRPAARSNVVPIGGRLGAAAAPAPSVEDELQLEPTRVSDPMLMAGADASPTMADPVAPLAMPTAPGAAAQAPGPAISPFGPPGAAPMSAAASYPSMERPARRSIPVGAWIAMVGAGAFGVAFAVMLATRLLSTEQPVAVAPAPAAPAPTQTTQVGPDLVLDPAEEQPSAEEGASAEQDGSGTRSGTRVRRNNNTGGTSSSSPPTKNLTAEQRALLERMGGGNDVSAPNLRMGGDGSDDSQRRGTGSLTEAQLSSVVSRNRPALQRCYETAIRGMGDPPTVRMDIDLTVGAAGGVSRVNVTGSGVGTLAACLESTVRRWRFPSAGEQTPLRFPVVFQPGA